MEGKSSTQREHFLYDDLPTDNIRHLMTLCPNSFDLETFLSSNCSKFAVEYDLISKISQNAQNLALF